MPTILIVDDSPTEVLLMDHILKKAGFGTLTAGSGEESLAMVHQYRPDLVLMDVVMPGLNGFQATRKLSRDPETKDIPVVIVTSKGQDTDRLWGMRQGARDYLIKPITEGALLSTIRLHLSD